jgi:Na+/proline symporter
MSYARFAAMIATSTAVMFGLMYLNTYALDHVLFSQTRIWMAFVMGAVMAVIMLGFMWSMYKNRSFNIAILAGAVVVFAGALWLVRSQETVDDVSYMKAMIPHHSIAIMTSERAHIRDPEVRKLADRIIDAQVREIAEMKLHIARLEAHPTPASAPALPSYRDRGVPPPPPETDQSAGVNTLAPIR